MSVNAAKARNIKNGLRQNKAVGNNNSNIAVIGGNACLLSLISKTLWPEALNTKPFCFACNRGRGKLHPAP